MSSKFQENGTLSTFGLAYLCHRVPYVISNFVIETVSSSLAYTLDVLKTRAQAKSRIDDICGYERHNV